MDRSRRARPRSQDHNQARYSLGGLLLYEPEDRSQMHLLHRKDGRWGMVFLIPIDVRNIGRSNHIPHHLPFAPALSQQGDDAIVESSCIDGCLVDRSVIIDRVSIRLLWGCSEERPPILHLQKINFEDHPGFQMLLDGLTQSISDELALWRASPRSVRLILC